VAADVIGPSVLWHFTPHQDWDAGYHRRRLERFTLAQKVVVAEYLRYMAARDAIEDEDLQPALAALAEE
jgi:hypothetical protein